MSGTRRRAFDALYDITEKSAYANLRLKEAQNGLSREDAKWVSAAVYETLDHLYYIDYVLAAFAKGKVDKRIRCVLRLGTCQILFMRVGESAACNESVKLAKDIGKAALSGYVNGVLRTLCRNRDNLSALPGDIKESLSVQYSYPRYIVDEYCNEYGEEFCESMLSYSSGHGITLRAQPPFTTQELTETLAERGIEFGRGKIASEAMKLSRGINIVEEPLFIDGKITVQSESAMLTCKALLNNVSLCASTQVLDACAAPGGKTAFLHALMQGRGELHAWELHPHRVALIEETLKRLHVENMHIETKDSSQYDEAYKNWFDAVLLDVPCSGLGVPGKPDARYQKTDAIIEELCAVQHSILDCCKQYVKPGGTLLYATCTISRRENEMQAERFLNENPDFAPGDFIGILPEGLQKRADGGKIQLFPHLDDTEGFFIAKFVKR